MPPLKKRGSAPSPQTIRQTWRTAHTGDLQKGHIMLTTRAATPPDIPALLDGIAQLAAHHGDISLATDTTLRQDLFAPIPWAHGLIAETDKTITGYVILLPLAQIQFGARGMDLHHLFTWPTHRGTGTGCALIEAAKTFARAQACTYLTVGTHPDNHSAQTYYLKHGFDLRPNSPRFMIRL